MLLRLGGGVPDVAADTPVPELLQDLGDGVLVDHDLGQVRRADPAGLDVDNHDLVGLLGDEIRLAGYGGGAALRRKRFWFSVLTV